MNTIHNPDDTNPAFKPPRFLFYYVQRVCIWGQWSIAQARYSYQRELLRYKQQQAQKSKHSGDTI
jgi:hypothetical protein